MDHFGRRVWDVEEYAKQAHNKQKQHQQEEEKDFSVHGFFSQRSTNLQKIDELNKISLVSSQLASSQSKRGKGIGFYCEYCNLTYKDNLQFIDHLNSKQHLYNSGFKDGDDENISQKNITLEQVKDYLERLKLKKDKEAEETGKVFSIKEHLERKRAFQERQREARRQKKIRQREKRDKNTQESDFSKIMGFDGFSSTKA